MDFINLPLTASGNNAAIVIVDKFTGWIECKPTPSQSSQFTCMALFEWICQYRLLKQIHCDNDSHFNAEEVKILMMSSYGIQLRFGVPYFPQGQGKVEKAKGVLKAIMKKLAQVYRENWDIWLPPALYVMRTSSRRDHGYSAFQLVYGRSPRLLTAEDEVFEDEVDLDEAMWIRIQAIVDLNQKVISQAKKNITKYKTSMIERYKKNTKIVKYYVNDLVQVVNHPAVTTKSSELLVQWLGPFRVHEVVGSAFTR